MLKSYYHATPFENLAPIFSEGIKTGCDGVIYLANKSEEAARFVAIRGHKKILTIEVKVDESLVEESFDHSESFFKCKAYLYPKNISIDEFGTNVRTYEL